MNRAKHWMAVIASASLLASAAAFADPPEGKGKSKGKGHGKSHASQSYGDDALVHVSVNFSDARRLAVDHGYTGYASLPPGIRKNLARGKPLPPGIAKKVVPGPMLQGLPRYDGYEWRVYGADLILVQVATAVIAEVLIDVFS